MARSAQQTVAEWVNSGVIADLLAESLRGRGMRVTVKNMKGLWLATLEDLGDTIDGVPDDRVRREACEQVKQKYVCPDCGWRLETRAHRIRCGGCGSLNLERELTDGRYIKADADETAPENEHLIHRRSKEPGGGNAP